MSEWKLVPVAPTREMWAAANKLDNEMAAGNPSGNGCSIEQAWECLLEAAPGTKAIPADKTFITSESGGGKYKVVIQCHSLKVMQQVHDAVLSIVSAGEQQP